MDYLIDEKEFIEYEAEIVLSGCIKAFTVPNMYRENGKIYWVYSDIKPVSLRGYSDKDIEHIQRLSKNYMLNPDHIVFHPDCISKGEGGWLYHYLPSERKLLYDSRDLKRYLTLERNRIIDASEIDDEVNITKTSIVKKGRTHILYNRNNGSVEKLLLKNTYIGGKRGKIDVDFSGELRIDHEGNAVLLSGEAYLNHQIMELQTSYTLNSGDNILCNKTEFLYW